MSSKGRSAGTISVLVSNETAVLALISGTGGTATGASVASAGVRLLSQLMPTGARVTSKLMAITAMKIGIKPLGPHRLRIARRGHGVPDLLGRLVLVAGVDQPAGRGDDAQDQAADDQHGAEDQPEQDQDHGDRCQERPRAGPGHVHTLGRLGVLRDSPRTSWDQS